MCTIAWKEGSAPCEAIRCPAHFAFDDRSKHLVPLRHEFQKRSRLLVDSEGGVPHKVFDSFIAYRHAATVRELPTMKPQEIPFDHPDSRHMFRPGPDKPFVATPDAIEMYQHETILACLSVLQAKAQQESGIDYLQIFDGASVGKTEDLWFLEDGPGGAITAILPSNY